MSSILKINKEACLSEALKTCQVVPAETLLSDKPSEKEKNHIQNDDVVIGTWEASPYVELLKMEGVAEFATILSGALKITTDDGASYLFRSGDSYFMPAGFSGRFEVLETLRKTYVLIKIKCS